jgi:hypothetical protein
MTDQGDLSELIADPHNLRKHNPRNIGLIEEGLREVGAARSVVVDENNILLAGNGVAEAAAAAGITRVRFIDADGDELIAVRRTGLSDEQKKRLAIYDNRSGDLSDWDAYALRDVQENAPELLDGLWYDDELDRDLARLERSEAMFEASTDPTASSHLVNEAEVLAAKAKLEGTYTGEETYTPVTCPECGHAFFLSPKDDPRG